MARKAEKKQYIKIRGANEHNLKNIDVDIPRNELVVLTGLSGSGKSSLAFDTIYAEGQRRYMESLSSYARQFLGQMEKPDVESIEGLSPAISIDQKSTNRNPRSTVGTVTEIYDYFRLLYARIGIPHCPKCGKEIKKQTVDQMTDQIMELPEGTKIRRFRVDNTIYMNFQNDISFDAGGKVIVFGEHQSTVNENMPLRSLLYIGRAYERLVPPRSRYKKKIVFLPTPEFYTFYNGKEKWEKEKELRLSDAYIVKDGEPSLELKVKVINIRPEEHHEILEKCQVLKEYSQFMEVVQNYQISGEEEPYKKAIKECIEKGILADYLMRKGSEVVNMLLDEYDYETDIEVQREEAREQGREEGRKQGREEGRKQGTLQKTCALIQKKLEKGKTISEIADDLEDTEENIAHLIEEFQLGRNGS